MNEEHYKEMIQMLKNLRYAILSNSRPTDYVM